MVVLASVALADRSTDIARGWSGRVKWNADRQEADMKCIMSSTPISAVPSDRPVLLTFIGYFFGNLNWPWYCRRDGEIVRFCAPISKDTECEWVDAENDIGVFAAGE